LSSPTTTATSARCATLAISPLIGLTVGIERRLATIFASGSWPGLNMTTEVSKVSLELVIGPASKPLPSTLSPKVAASPATEVPLRTATSTSLGFTVCAVRVEALPFGPPLLSPLPPLEVTA